MSGLARVAVPVRQLTSPPHAHFFGYYDKPPWNADGSLIACLAAHDHHRMPQAGEAASITVLPAAGGTGRVIAHTLAWNWQQACMLQWNPVVPDRQLLWNDQRGGAHVAVLHDLSTGSERVYDRPIYSISTDGRWALSVSLARLAHARPVVGYAGVSDPHARDLHPASDGIWLMDLASGASRLVLSLDRVARLAPLPTMAGVHHRFEHVVFNPSGTKFFCLHRWPRSEVGRAYHDRLLVANRDGSDLCIVADEGFVSHFDWRDDGTILAWARHGGVDAYWHFDVTASHAPHSLGLGSLTVDGHCSYSADRRWVLTDTYPLEDGCRAVIVADAASGQAVEVGRFASPPPFHRGDIRCDLHPRWNRDGTQACIDSVHSGASRQMYILDLRPALAHLATARPSPAA